MDIQDAFTNTGYAFLSDRHLFVGVRIFICRLNILSVRENKSLCYTIEALVSSLERIVVIQDYRAIYIWRINLTSALLSF